MRKLPSGKELLGLAKKYGLTTKVMTGADLIDQLVQHREGEADLQSRLIEFKRQRREAHMWVVALVSAIASVLSAATAIVVVLHTQGYLP